LRFDNVKMTAMNENLIKMCVGVYFLREGQVSQLPACLGFVTAMYNDHYAILLPVGGGRERFMSPKKFFSLIGNPCQKYFF
jgi:hypothetical protein